MRPSHYDLILMAARHHDESALQTALALGATIDEWKPGYSFFSASSQLAAEGNGPSVEFLRRRGANINYIACGSAFGGYREYADSLGEGWHASVHFIAYGAAFGGHCDHAELLRKQGASIDCIASGAALGGYREYAEFLRRAGASISYIALAAAQAGDYMYAEFLRQTGADINFIASGAAQGGYFFYADFLKLKGADIHCIASGAAQGGYFQYSEFLRSKGADIHSIAACAARGGHRSYAEFLRRQGAFIDRIAYDAAYSRHYEYVQFLGQQGATMSVIVWGAEAGGSLGTTNNITCFLLFFDDSSFREALIYEIMKLSTVSLKTKDKMPLIRCGVEYLAHVKEEKKLTSLPQVMPLSNERKIIHVFFPQIVSQRSCARPALPVNIVSSIPVSLKALTPSRYSAYTWIAGVTLFFHSIAQGELRWLTPFLQGRAKPDADRRNTHLGIVVVQGPKATIQLFGKPPIEFSAALMHDRGVNNPVPNEAFYRGLVCASQRMAL